MTIHHLITTPPEDLERLNRLCSNIFAVLANDDTDLTLSQLAVLLCCALDPGIGQREIAERAGIRKPRISRAADALGARLLVTRRIHDEDARRVSLRLQTAGVTYVADLAERLAAAEQGVSQRWLKDSGIGTCAIRG